MGVDYIQLRNGIYQFRITVPKHQRDDFHGKREIGKSLKTRDRKKALVEAGPLIDYYTRLFAGEELLPPERSTRPQLNENANRLGLDRYRTDEEYASAPVSEGIPLYSPIIALLKQKSNLNDAELQTLAGVHNPGLTLDEMFTRYQALSRGAYADLDKRAAQQKRNRYAEVVEDFKREMGDLDVLKITSTIAADYAVTIGNRIESKKFNADTGKRKLIFLNAMIQKVFNADYSERTNPFIKTEIDHTNNEKTKRRPFTEAEMLALRKKLASSTASEEVKAILTVLEFTGTHAKEICLLTASDIHTEAEIPFFRVGVNSNRKILKTGGARHRSLPMLPEVVEVFRRFPNGFPSYARSGGSDAFSATANKLIKQVADGATTYSFRHRMVDLLRNTKCDHALIQEIVGHNGGITGDYGEGTELEIRLEAMQAAMARAEEKQKLVKQY